MTIDPRRQVIYAIDTTKSEILMIPYTQFIYRDNPKPLLPSPQNDTPVISTTNDEPISQDTIPTLEGETNSPKTSEDNSSENQANENITAPSNQTNPVSETKNQPENVPSESSNMTPPEGIVQQLQTGEPEWFPLNISSNYMQNISTVTIDERGENLFWVS